MQQRIDISGDLSAPAKPQFVAVIIANPLSKSMPDDPYLLVEVHT